MGLVIKMINGTKKGDYKNKDAVKKLVHYILSNAKAQIPKGERIYGSLGAGGRDEKRIVESFMKTKKIFYKTEGVQIIHMVISFGAIPDLRRDVIKKTIIKILYPVSEDFQVFYGIHYNDGNYHCHVAINSISYDGKRLHICKNELASFKRRAERIWEKACSKSIHNVMEI